MEERLKIAEQYLEKQRREEEAERVDLKQQKDELRTRAVQRALELMNRFGVRQALEDVRVKWGDDGVIREMHRTYHNRTIALEGTGLGLVYPVTMPQINLHPLGSMNVETNLRRETALEIFVGPNIQENPEEDPVLVLANRGMFRNSLSFHPLNVRREILAHGLFGGLTRLQDVLLAQDPEEKQFIVEEFDSPDAVERFNVALVGVVFDRNEFFLPRQLRARADRIIDQFPSALRETGRLGPEDLKRWEHDLVWGNGLLSGLRILRDRIVASSLSN